MAFSCCARGETESIVVRGQKMKRERQKKQRMEDWEIIADNLKEAGFRLGWVSTRDRAGRMIWMVDAHGYGKLFIVHADQKLTAFVELERAIFEFAVCMHFRSDHSSLI